MIVIAQCVSLMTIGALFLHTGIAKNAFHEWLRDNYQSLKLIKKSE